MTLAGINVDRIHYLMHYNTSRAVADLLIRRGRSIVRYDFHSSPVIPFQLLDIVYREETLLNVMRSVTRNGRSILLTAVLALVLVYMFSIVGYMFFRDHFLVNVDRLDGESAASSSVLTRLGRYSDSIL